MFSSQVLYVHFVKMINKSSLKRTMGTEKERWRELKGENVCNLVVCAFHKRRCLTWGCHVKWAWQLCSCCCAYAIMLNNSGDKLHYSHCSNSADWNKEEWVDNPLKRRVFNIKQGPFLLSHTNCDDRWLLHWLHNYDKKFAKLSSRLLSVG